MPRPYATLSPLRMRFSWRLVALLALTAGNELAAQEGRSEMIPTELFESGVPVQLELVVHRPPGAGPFPTLVFNHGSVSPTHGGNVAVFQVTRTYPSVASYFNARGWQVIFPQRRGRGKSGGLYDEGLNPERTAYTCDPVRSLAGVDRALVDIDQVVAHLHERDDVDTRQLLIGGHSRGGALAVAYVGTRPGVFAGALNFVGGWAGNVYCPDAESINPVVFRRGGPFEGPTLWLYGDNDSYNTTPHIYGNFAAFLASGGRGEFYFFPTPPGEDGHFLSSRPTLWERYVRGFVDGIPGPYPIVVAKAGVAEVALGGAVTLSVTSAGTPANYQWASNGVTLDAPSRSTLSLPFLYPSLVGLYHAAVTNAGVTTESTPHIVGLLATERLHGTGSLAAGNVVHPNGTTYDQFLLEGGAVSVTADPGEVARLSFVDLNDDIVQVEFSGAGTLTLVMSAPGVPAPPANYHQPNVNYVKGHAGIVLAGADETSHVSVFTVGRANAVNQALFRDDVAYDGVADLAFLAISSRNGRFGGVRTANTNYFATRGFTGFYAPGVAFDGPVFLGNIAAHDSAVPMLTLGSVSEVGITGGDLFQPNGRAVQIAGLTRLRFLEGRTSHDRALPAQTNRAQFEERGLSATDRVAIEH